MRPIGFSEFVFIKNAQNQISISQECISTEKSGKMYNQET